MIKKSVTKKAAPKKSLKKSTVPSPRKPTIEDPSLQILQTSKCRTISDKSELTANIAVDDKGTIQVRINNNTGGGYWSREWVSFDQIMSTLNEIGCSVIPIDLPYGAMHLMGLLRFLDRDLAIAWRRRTPYAAIEALRQSGVQVEFPAFVERAAHYRAINFVTLGPRRILMPAGADDVQSFYAGLGVECLTTPTEELSKAAGSTGCLTGVLSRQLA